MDNMKKAKDFLSTYIFLTVLLSIIVFAAGCATYRPAKSEKSTSTQCLSLKGAGTEFGRGFSNVSLCWLEVPHEIEARIREGKTGHPFGIIRNSFKVAIATLHGSIWAAQRASGGAVEIALSPFPPHEPIMEPAFPPYLNFGKEIEKEPKQDTKIQ